VARIEAPVLETWECRRLNCQARNLARDSHCSVCEAPKPGGRPRSFERVLPAVDLDEFLRTNFTRGAKRHRAEVHIINNEVFLTLTPDHRDGGDPAVYHAEHNALAPCDSLGRTSW
jgi:hypothetical protein